MFSSKCQMELILSLIKCWTSSNNLDHENQDNRNKEMGGIARTFLCIIVQGLRLFPRYDDSLEQVGTELGQAQLK